MRIVYQEIARALNAIGNCKKDNNDSWGETWQRVIEDVVKNYLPSGSGIDSGTKFDFDRSNDNKLIFYFGFHFMNDGGFYDGWEKYTLYVRPSLKFDIDLKISGKNRRDIKEYLYETYQYSLTRDIPEEEFKAIIKKFQSTRP